MSIVLNREICASVAEATQREWLVTNGIGGFAMGTIAGALTRRYHGLLLAATRPPVVRALLVPKVDEIAVIEGREYRLFTNIWNTGIESPNATHHLTEFAVRDGIPEWTFDLGGRRLVRRIWMAPRQNTTFVRYELSPGAAVRLSCRFFANHRDYHALVGANGRGFQVDSLANGIAVRESAANAALVTIRAAASSGKASWSTDNTWFCGFHLPIEHARGFDFKEDHLSVGVCDVDSTGGDLTFAISADDCEPAAADAALAVQRDSAANRVASLIQANKTKPEHIPAAVHALIDAADHFIVARASPDSPDGYSIIAGYPWFTDWGRDTMIALPGLLLTTGRFDIARAVLLTWSRYVDRGMIPNRFTDVGEQPEYHTGDATLWYLWAIAKYFDATGDRQTLTQLFPVMREIISWHHRGTRHGIRADADGLLFAGEPGVNLTWMDAKVGERVITPRVGKPIEINALWYNALANMERLATALGEPSEEYAAAAERARASFRKFWNAPRECCFDVVDGPDGNDAALRPNQIFAVSLEHSPLDPSRRSGIVAACERHLLTPFGLRTLAPGEPGYVGHYRGGPAERDASYHQGTAWGWLLGPFVLAHYRVYGNATRARELLSGMLDHTSTNCIGSISEIFDAESPHAAAGCSAQAWSVAETLRAWCATQL